MAKILEVNTRIQYKLETAAKVNYLPEYFSSQKGHSLVEARAAVSFAASSGQPDWPVLGREMWHMPLCLEAAYA